MTGTGILLDTHIALWALTNSTRLSDAARKILLSDDNEIYYSAASVWELTVKHGIHPEHLPFSGTMFARYCREAGYIPLPVEKKHVFALETLRRPDDAPRHKDPFDRILIAQAKAENLFLLTHDALIPYYNEPCIIKV